MSYSILRFWAETKDTKELRYTRSFALLCRVGENYLILPYTVALIAKLSSFNWILAPSLEDLLIFGEHIIKAEDQRTNCRSCSLLTNVKNISLNIIWAKGQEVRYPQQSRGEIWWQGEVRRRGMTRAPTMTCLVSRCRIHECANSLRFQAIP